MKVIYTDHALERLRDRGISKKSVKDALVRGHHRESQSGGLIRLLYVERKKTLVVIYRVIGKDRYLIITSYYAD